MVYWLVRHLMIVFLLVFIVVGFLYQDELFDDQAMQSLLALAEVNTLLTVANAEPKNEPKVPANTAEYSFRPLSEPTESSQTPTPTPTPTTPLSLEQPVVPFTIVAPSVSNPTVEESKTLLPGKPLDAMNAPAQAREQTKPDLAKAGGAQVLPTGLDGHFLSPPLIRPDVLRRDVLPPGLGSFEALERNVEAPQLAPIFGQRRYIPHSYSVQPPELLRSPAADFPEADSIMPPSLVTPFTDSALQLQAAFPAVVPDILPRQQTLSHGLIEPHYPASAKVGLATPQDQALPEEGEIAPMGPALSQARAAFWVRDYARSEQLYIDLIRHFPDSGSLFGELGNVYYAQGQMAQAAVVWSESIVRLARQNKLKHAKFSLDRLWRIDPRRARMLVEQLPSLAQ